jgi:nucleoside-diphosphate kinase
MPERTLVVLKPDAMRRLVGRIISRFEKEGLRIAGMKMVAVDRNFAAKHYPDSDEQLTEMGNKTLNAGGEEKARELFGTTSPREIGLKLREWMIDFITSGLVVVTVLEGEDAVEKARRIVGFTDPSKAEKGTIRGDFGIDSIVKANNERRACENLVHASGSAEEAAREISLWFPPEELF